MLKKLTRKLFTLLVLVAALTAVSSAPTSSAKSQRYCLDVPICYGDCCSGYWCCDRWGNCTCG
jgi:hypothetical protein